MEDEKEKMPQFHGGRGSYGKSRVHDARRQFLARQQQGNDNGATRNHSSISRAGCAVPHVSARWTRNTE